MGKVRRKAIQSLPLKSARWFAVCLLSLMVSGQAQTVAGRADLLTTEERAWLTAHPVLYLAPDPAYEPVEFFDEQNVFRGISADYVALLEQRLGFHFQVVNRHKVQAAWDAGQVRVDAMPTCVATPERAKTWTFTTPYLEFPTYLITRKSVSETLPLAQLKGSRVAVVASYGVEEYLATKYPQLILDPVPDTRTGLQKASFGLVDAFVSDLPVATYWMEREGITNLKASGEVGYVYQLGFGLPSDRGPLDRILEKGLAQITPEERAAIYHKWVKLQVEPSQFSRRLRLGLLGGLGVVGVGLLFVLWWNRSLAVQVKQRTAELQQELSERQQAEKQLKVSEQQLHQLADYLQTVREDERTAIAREIHDELGQSLTAMKIDLVRLSNFLPGPSTVAQGQVDSLLELINTTIHTVRKLASQLRPGVLDDLGLTAAVEWQAQEFQTRTGIACDLVELSEVSDLAPERATALFRICQEALTNVARHAQATQVSLCLQETPTQVRLEVKDNGRGVTAGELANPRSLGLLGMRERVFLLGGEFTLEGKTQQGTTVTVQIPRQQAKAQGGAQ